MQEIRVPHFTTFNFITSDSLRSVKLGFGLYLIPFDVPIWCCTCASIVLITFVLHRLSTVTSGVVLVVLSVSGNLLDQGSKVLQSSTNKWKSNSKLILIPFWLLSGIIISNGYKGLLNMAYIAENDISTKWKNPHEMSNFTLYLPKGINSVNCFKSPSNFCVIHCKSRSGELIYGNTEFDVILQNYSTVLRQKQFHCVRTGNFVKWVQKNLISPKTALVVFSHHLDFYWKEIQNAARQGGLKFAHNGKTLNDPSLGMPHSIYVFKSFQEKYDYAGKRAKIALSSGLFLLWLKWDKIKFQARNLESRTKESNEADVRPLALNSSFALVILALLWGLVLCIAIFIIERTRSFFR
ncbi:unnamed protein product [Allacma fusca]|uniref:Uncharacterized protein n=1 Tax=Allacma fusca TaxID=39272 RepID=A0A8J2KQJ6_9HEXA|nr:unnamed protein product [Allacma fusca]